MKSLVKNIFIILLFVLAVPAVRADFSSLYVFGDGLSTTGNNPSAGALYYGQRFSNGRVWAEVLAQRQGLTLDATKNNSYFDHNSAALLSDINNFKAPPDVANDLFIVWVCNADTYDSTTVAINSSTQNHAIDAIAQSQTNHLQIITALYAKGVRTLLMPNAVDISEIPAFDASSFASVMHNESVIYNAAFSNTINQAMALCPGLTIYTPDFFTLLNNVLANAASYGLTNVLSGKFSTDALDDPRIFKTVAINGPGTNYIYWDKANPTAKLHEIMADVAQQIISPVQISGLAVFNGSNRLDVVNYPAGLSGFVDGSTNLVQPNWTSVQNFNSTNMTQSIFVSASPLRHRIGPPDSPNGSILIQSVIQAGSGTNGVPVIVTAQFYRLHFPYAWSWP